MKFSVLGKIAKQYWQNIPNHYLYTKLDTFTIMPNHIHGIIIIHHRSTNGGNTVPGGNTVLAEDAVLGGDTINDLFPNDPFWDGRLTGWDGRSTVPTKRKQKLQPSPNSLSIVIRNYKAAVTPGPGKIL